MNSASFRVVFRPWLGVAVLIWILFAAAARAQDEAPQLADLQIAVWPEYDQASVLVIYDGTLDSSVSLPRQLRLPLPAGARVHAVAYRNEQAQLMTLPWEAESTDQGDQVVFETEQPQFVVEYYADGIAPPPQRSFDLALGLPAAAQQVTLEVRQPSGASNMRIEPELAAAGLDNLGNPRFSTVMGAREAGDAIQLAVSYDKPNDVPSLAAAPAAAAGVPADTVQEDSEAVPDWVALTAGVGLGLAVAGAALYLINRSRQAGGDTRQARRRKARQAGRSGEVKEPRPAQSGGGDQFCRQCGQRFTSGDRFCRACGAARQQA